jgi:AraC-like DNA-binding protein
MTQAPVELVSARSVRALDAAARAIGIHLDIALLAPSVERPRANELIPVAEEIGYCRALLSDERETLGLELAQKMPLEVTGLWGFLLRSSATYGDMLRRAERYIRIVNKYPEFALEERGGLAVLTCDHPDESPYGNRPQAVLVMMGHWVSWGRQLTGMDFPLVKTCFKWSGPRDRRPFEDFFKGPVHFNAAEDAFFFDKETMQLRLRESTPELAAQFESMAAALIKEMTPASNMLDQVRSALCEELLAGSAQLEDVARRLAMTPRTLHRRLAEHRTTFRKLKDELLRARAQGLMVHEGLSLTEASYLLGYSEPANFNRAFRRWTGLAPSLWRQRES